MCIRDRYVLQKPGCNNRFDQICFRYKICYWTMIKLRTFFAPSVFIYTIVSLSRDKKHLIKKHLSLFSRCCRLNLSPFSWYYYWYPWRNKRSSSSSSSIEGNNRTTGIFCSFSTSRVKSASWTSRARTGSVNQYQHFQHSTMVIKSVRLSTCPPVRLSTCPPVHLSACPSIRPSARRPVRPSACPPVHLRLGFFFNIFLLRSDLAVTFLGYLQQVFVYFFYKSSLLRP